MSTRNFVIARTEEEALAMAEDDSPIYQGLGFETIEQAQHNLKNIKGLIPFLPPTDSGIKYQIYQIFHHVVLIP